MNALLAVDGLRVSFEPDVQAIRGVSFDLLAGETLAVVGETGAGKTTLALSLVGLIQPPLASGSVRLDGMEVLGASPTQLREVQWSRIAIALQGTPFNPVTRIGDQIAEPMRHHLRLSAGEARRKTGIVSREMRLSPELLDRYPHQLSGGERRRASLAMALALDPQVLVLDEPTAGLDPGLKHELCRRISQVSRERDLALVVITHDLSDAHRLTERCLVLYAGEVMEHGTSDRVLGDPVHPYTRALVGSYPVMSTTKELRTIRGAPPDPRAVPSGCSFHPRCTQAANVCVEERVLLTPSRGRDVACHFGGMTTVLSARSVSKSFDTTPVLAEVTLEVGHGEAVGIIGVSGSGKTTLARILTGHTLADSGEVQLEGSPLPSSWRRADRYARRRIQLLMQDPSDSLSPRLTVEELVREPLDLDGLSDTIDRETVGDALGRVGLPPSGDFLRARTHELSGGQLQRVALARALVARPKVLVADEPTASLDASEQARVLLLLKDLQVEEGLGLVLISHDIALVRKVTDRILVLDGGRIVEEGLSHHVSSSPRTEAARHLVNSAARLDIPNATIQERGAE